MDREKIYYFAETKKRRAARQGDRETWNERGWTGDHNESSRFWGILNVLIRGIPGDESGITHHRPHHAWERVHQNCLISTSLDYHQ